MICLPGHEVKVSTFLLNIGHISMKHSKAYIRLLIKEKIEEESKEMWNDVIHEMAWVADDMADLYELLED